MPRTRIPSPTTRGPTTKDCKRGGSIISCRDRSVSDSIPLADVDERVHWSSSRGPARSAADDQVEVRITRAAPPASVEEIRVTAIARGRRYEEVLEPAANLTWSFALEDTDVYGRPADRSRPGRADGGVRVRHAVLRERGGVLPVVGRYGRQRRDRGRRPTATPASVTFSKTTTFVAGAAPAPDDAGLGGWTLSSHHRLDPVGRVVELGTGE